MIVLDEQTCVALAASASSKAMIFDEPAIDGGGPSSSIAAAVHQVRPLVESPINCNVSLGRNPICVDVAIELHIVRGTVRGLH